MTSGIMAVEEKEKTGIEIQENQETELNSTDLGLDDKSPRAVVEASVLVSDSDNSSSSSNSSSGSPDKASSLSSNFSSANHGLQWYKMIDNIKKKSVRRFSVIPLLATYENTRKNLRRKLGKASSAEQLHGVDCEQILGAKPSWRNFTYEELAAATDDFSPENLIGKGGHAEVYKGKLPDGETVAIKKLMCHDKEEEERVSAFLSELGIIAHVSHHNAARLLGFSSNRGLHFVLEYSPHGSLSSLLFGSEEGLDWKKRFKVAVGIADGLSYLHNDCPKRIIHRDIKASNILLNQDYEAQISDFGLAKWLPENWPHHIVFPIEGTFGYLAPEYFMHGIVDEKTDVFAFGVLLLELITGRRAVDTASRESLVMWAKPFLEKNSVAELVDPWLTGKFDLAEMKRMMLTASMCIHHLATMRPHMSQVVLLLRGEGSVELQQKSPGGRTVILDGCDHQDYTFSSYLDDLTRHMQLVME